MMPPDLKSLNKPRLFCRTRLIAHYAGSKVVSEQS
jgi:hypothetical protein